MSTTIAVRRGALAHAASDVHAATALLHDGTTDARRGVTALLADWQGRAADSFAVAFDEWLEAASACIEALERIGVAIVVTEAALVASDAQAERQLTDLGAALGGR